MQAMETAISAIPSYGVTSAFRSSKVSSGWAARV